MQNTDTTGVPARLCFLLESYLPIINGGSVQVSRLLDPLSAAGAEVTVVSRRLLSTDAPVERHGSALVVKAGPLFRARWLGKFLSLPWYLAALVRHRRRYDVIVVCDMKVLGVVGVAAARLLGKKCFLRAESCGEIDGSYGTRYGQFRMTRPRRVAFRAAIRLRNGFLRLSDGFLSICAPIEREFFASCSPSRQLIRITNGVDTAQFAPATAERRAELRRRIGLVDGDPGFVYTGRLSRGKGLDVLIDAWRRFLDDGGKGRLFILGSGQGMSLSVEQDLRDMAATADVGETIVFAGRIGDVRDYLQACDVFVLPSQSEATSLALIEAMSCGLACIATAVDGNLDLVRDRWDGRLVPYGDAAALADAMRLLAASPAERARLGAAARAAVRARNDVRTVARSYLALAGAGR